MAEKGVGGRGAATRGGPKSELGGCKTIILFEFPIVPPPPHSRPISHNAGGWDREAK